MTGYRRRGTRVADMRAIIGASITARAIYEPLQSCPIDAPAEEMKLALEARDFDVAGVRQTRQGPVIGIVYRADLVVGTVRDYLRPLTPEHLLSDSTHLGELFLALRTVEQVFVLIGRHVEGIVTQADFNKPPVRVYLFGLVSLLEMHLSYWIRATYTESSWRSTLQANRVQEADRVLAERTARNDGSTLIDCLQFCDKRDLIVEQETVRNALGLGSKAAAKRFLRSAESLRNDLAHSQPTLVGRVSWPEMIELVTQIEEFVHGSDVQIETSAQAGAVLTPTLW